LHGNLQNGIMPGYFWTVGECPGISNTLYMGALYMGTTNVQNDFELSGQAKSLSAEIAELSESAPTSLGVTMNHSCRYAPAIHWQMQGERRATLSGIVRSLQREEDTVCICRDVPRLRVRLAEREFQGRLRACC
jgi:hypothetical protein